MTILGITGPTGSGKTTFLRRVEARDGLVLDLDAVYHGLLETSPAMLGELEARFPGTVQDGKLDRKALGAIVFRDPEALRDLGAITGRYILEETDRQLRAAEAAGRKLAAIDAINLLEGDLPKRCGATVAVVAPVEVRVKRIMARDGITEEYARARIAAQRPGEYFIERCDYALVNDAGEAEFAEKCDRLLDEILRSGKDE